MSAHHNTRLIPAACLLGMVLCAACDGGTVTTDSSVLDSSTSDTAIADSSGGDGATVRDGGDRTDTGPEGPPARCRDFGPVRAFPGAVGFGASSAGGRGGQVLYVDNLDDRGPGSLRAAVETEGARIVVFSVAGTIELESSLNLSHSNITIAGHSAPGGGIALRTADSVTSPAIVSGEDDVVLQHLRVRPGASTELSNSVDAITVTGGQRIILANMSFSWAVDENVNFWYDASDITLQDSIVSEGLFMSTHTYEMPHSKGLIAGPDNARMSLVRNLFAHNDDRSPLIQSGHPYELVNNIIYNGYQVGTFLSLLEGTQASLVGNVYLPGPNYRPSRYQIVVGGSPLIDSSVYVDDNLSPRSDPTDPWTAMGWSGVHGGDYNGSPLPESVRAATAFTMSDAPPAPSEAGGLVDRLLPTVGATLPLRDAVDERIVGDVRNGTGGLIDSVAEVGGWPTLASGDAPADGDRDGMPDAWELARGLDPADPADASGDRDGDGYTNIEERLACL